MRCYILGAGFSRGCGFPLATELTWPVFHHAWQDRNDKSSSPPLISKGTAGHEVMEDHLRVIRLLFPEYPCTPEQPKTWPDFEQLITTLDEAIRFQNDVQIVTGERGRAWAAELKKVLIRNLEVLLGSLVTRAPAAALGLMGEFIKSLDVRNDFIVSFNWDTLLEVAAKIVGVPVDVRANDHSGLTVIKPHGSIDVVELAVSKWEESRSAINVHSLTQVAKYDIDGVPHVVMRAEDPGDAVNRTVGPFVHTTLVEPNLRKQYLSPWLQLQWTFALRVARQADEIVLLGYSLPDADLRPRLLLQLAGVDRDPPPRIVIVSPAPSASKTAASVKRAVGRDPVVIEKTWETWFAEGGTKRRATAEHR